MSFFLLLDTDLLPLSGPCFPMEGTGAETLFHPAFEANHQ
jgi:hypothetical protein